jgi:tetrahedral aminopeptidase
VALRELLERLTRVPGPSGYEDAVAVAVQEELAGLPGETTVDGIGNLVLRLPASEPDAPALMLMAHLDQVGLFVKYVDDDGMLYCEANGLVDERSLAASKVDIWTDDGVRVGLVGVRSRHLLSERDLATPPTVGELWVHVGATDAAGVAALGIDIGQPATLRSETVWLSDDVLVGPSIDNRAGCAALVELALALAGRERDFELQLVWSTQEEVGSRGARVAAQWLQPTVAVVVDTLPAGDASTPARHATSRVGSGPVVRAQDNRAGKGTIYAPAVRRRLLELARANDIPHQSDVFPTWTDACEVHLAGRGVATGGVFIPRLCSHTPNELLDIRDLERTVALLTAFCETDAGTLRRLATRPAFPLGSAGASS